MPTGRRDAEDMASGGRRSHAVFGRAGSSRTAATSNTHSGRGGRGHASTCLSTSLCRYFFNTGHCRFGTACRFIHSEQQQQQQVEASSSWRWLRMTTRRWLPLQLEPSTSVVNEQNASTCMPSNGSAAAATASAAVAVTATAPFGSSESNSSRQCEGRPVVNEGANQNAGWGPSKSGGSELVVSG